jgi:hypothetical protein
VSLSLNVNRPIYFNGNKFFCRVVVGSCLCPVVECESVDVYLNSPSYLLKSEIWFIYPPVGWKSKYMLMSRKKAGQKHGIKIAIRSFEGVAKFKYLGTTLTDQNCMQEEIKGRLHSGNACYHSVHSFVFPSLV